MTWPNAGPHATKVIDGKSTGNRANKKRVGQTVASEMRTLPPKITVSSSAARPCPLPAADAEAEHRHEHQREQPLAHAVSSALRTLIRCWKRSPAAMNGRRQRRQNREPPPRA